MTKNLNSRIANVFYWRDKAADTSTSFSRDAYYEVVDILKELTIRETKLVEALKYYADEENYDNNCAPFKMVTSHECVHEFIQNDLGKLARNTLSELNIV